VSTRGINFPVLWSDFPASGNCEASMEALTRRAARPGKADALRCTCSALRALTPTVLGASRCSRLVSACIVLKETFALNSYGLQVPRTYTFRPCFKMKGYPARGLSPQGGSKPSGRLPSCSHRPAVRAHSVNVDRSRAIVAMPSRAMHAGQARCSSCAYINGTAPAFLIPASLIPASEASCIRPVIDNDLHPTNSRHSPIAVQS